MRTMLALLLVAAAGASCSSGPPEERPRSGADRPETNVPPAEDSSEKVVCIRAEAAAFPEDARRSLLSVLALATDVLTDPSGRNGLAVYRGESVFARALARQFKLGAGAHPVQLVTVRASEDAQIAVGSVPRSGRFPFWGEWDGVERGGQEVSVESAVPLLLVRPSVQDDGAIELDLTPALQPPDPDRPPVEVTALRMRATLPTGGAAVVTPVGGRGSSSFGGWYLGRSGESGTERIFLVLHVHCLN